MPGRLVTAASLAAAALLVLAGHAGAQEGRLESEVDSIAIDAESIAYDQKADVVAARGGVLIRRGETELRADQVEVQRATSEIHAFGSVVLSDPEGTLRADDARVNLDEETGRLEHSQLFLSRQGYFLSGDRIEKHARQRFRIVNGRFTTCACEDGPPSWSIAGDEIDFEVNGYGKLRGGRFNILDRPILYLPRAVFPVTRERQSGFLQPRFGFSDRRGFQAIVPYYWAINRSHDLNVALDVESEARLGLLAEYRYALSAGSTGELNASYFNEIFRSASERVAGTRRISDPTIPVNRGSLVGWHTQGLPAGAGGGYIDLFLVSDDSFLREVNTFAVDYGRDVLNRTRRYTESRMGLARAWDRAAVRADATYYQDLIQDDEITLHSAPALYAWGQRAIAGGVAHGRFDAGVAAFHRERGIDGVRVDLRPALTVPIRTGLPLFANVRAAARETAYALTERRMRGGLDPTSTASWVLELPGTASREVVEIGGEIGTELSRVYALGGGEIRRLKHTIEPVLAYHYVPQVGQDDLPMFDDADRIGHRNLMSYGVTSRLFGKFAATEAGGANDEATAVREIGRLSVMQSYDVGRHIAPVGEPPGGPGGDNLSDIDVAVRANPFRSTSVLMRSSYDSSDKDISAAAIAVRFTDPRPARRRLPARLESRSSAAIGYRFITQNILQQVDGSLLLHFTDYLGAMYAARYDVLAGRLLENHFGFRLLSRCDCWGLDLAVTDKTNPREVELRVQLTLVGLGSSPGAGLGAL